MGLQWLVEVHDAFDWGVEAREQLGRDNEELQRVSRVEEAVSDGDLSRAFAIEDVPFGRIVLGGRHDDHRLFTRQKMLLDLPEIPDAQLPIERDHLPFEPERLDLAPVVVHDVGADGLDPGGCLEEPIDAAGSAGQIATLVFVETRTLGQLCERLVQGVAVDLEVNEASLDMDRQRRPVGDRPLHGVVVEHAFGIVGIAKGRPCVAVGRRDRRAGEANEPGVRKRRPHIETQAAFLRTVGLVHHHDDVRSIVEEASVGEPEDGRDDDATRVFSKQTAQMLLGLCHLEPRQADRGELRTHLFDQVEPVEDDEDRRRIEVGCLA